jgi:hypothetical protein
MAWAQALSAVKRMIWANLVVSEDIKDTVDTYPYLDLLDVSSNVLSRDGFCSVFGIFGSSATDLPS